MAHGTDGSVCVFDAGGHGMCGSGMVCVVVSRSTRSGAVDRRDVAAGSIREGRLLRLLCLRLLFPLQGVALCACVRARACVYM